MAKSRITRSRRHTDRHGQAQPAEDTTTLTTACLTGRCGTCRGQVISLLYTGPCTHPHHAAQLPAAWADQVAAFPPCELDGGEAA